MNVIAATISAVSARGVGIRIDLVCARGSQGDGEIRTEKERHVTALVARCIIQRHAERINPSVGGGSVAAATRPA